MDFTFKFHSPQQDQEINETSDSTAQTWDLPDPICKQDKAPPHCSVPIPNQPNQLAHLNARGRRPTGKTGQNCKI